MWSIRSSARILWSFQVLSTCSVCCHCSEKMGQRECPCARAHCSWAELCSAVPINCLVTPHRRRESWIQFPKETQAGYRSRVILPQEVLFGLTSPTVTALDRQQCHGGRAPKRFPQGLRVMETPQSTLWLSGL